MKKRYSLIVLFILMTLVMTSCANSNLLNKSYKYDLSEYIKLADYKNLKYEAPEINIDTMDIATEISKRMSSYSKVTKEKTGVLKIGDEVNIDYNGTLSDGSSPLVLAKGGYDIILGSDTQIPGFESGLIGYKVGDTVKLKLKFSENYTDDEGSISPYAGKGVTFTVNINYIKRTKIPKYNEDFIKKDSDGKYQTKEEYTNYIKEYLTNQAQEQYKAQLKDTLWAKVITESKVIKYPKKELKEKKESIKKNYESIAKSLNMTFPAFIKSQGMSSMAFEESINTYAKYMVKEEMIAYQIGRKEGLSVKYKEYRDYLQTILDAYKMTDSQFEDQMGMTIDEYGETASLKTSLIVTNISDFVVSTTIIIKK